MIRRDNRIESILEISETKTITNQCYLGLACHLQLNNTRRSVVVAEEYAR